MSGGAVEVGRWLAGVTAYAVAEVGRLRRRADEGPQGTEWLGSSDEV